MRTSKEMVVPFPEKGEYEPLKFSANKINERATGRKEGGRMFEKRQSFVTLGSVKCSVNSALFASDSNRFLRDSLGLALHSYGTMGRDELSVA